MKKLMITAIAMLMLTIAVNAQAVRTKIVTQKVERDAVKIEYKYSSKIVENAIDDYMKAKKSSKGKGSKTGFTIYDQVTAPEIGNDLYKFYFNTEKRSKKEDNISSVTMLLSSGFDVFAASGTNDSELNNAASFLNNLTAYIDQYALGLQIEDQQKVLDKSSKKAKSLEDDKSDLLKKKEKLEKDIIDNQSEIEKQKAQLEKEQQMLEALKIKKVPA